VAGKTGTVKKVSSSGGYTKKSYIGVFAGFAPVSNPRLAMVVMVDDPKQGGYYGGLVAGPVFKNVMAGALRLLNIAPDKIKKQITTKAIDEQIDKAIADKVGEKLVK
jgi:cell division protein FtsI (penicillin-binding protein 3)